MHQSRKGIFVYKYDFYGFDPILSYMINVTRERFRVTPVLCDAMTRCSRSRGSTTLSIITCFRGFEDINVHLVHQHVIYFLLPHEEHPIYRSFARPGHMEKSAMLERKLHSETSKTTKQNNSYQLSLTCLWFGSFLQPGTWLTLYQVNGAAFKRLWITLFWIFLAQLYFFFLCYMICPLVCSYGQVGTVKD